MVHQFAPKLSPKKTVEGAIGGALGAGAIVFIYVTVLSNLEKIVVSSSDVMLLVVIGCIGAILSQFGDLAASSIKRSVDVKDFGHLFPGHGGILDRFDSILLISPLIYCVATMILPL